MNELVRFAWDVLLFRQQAYAEHVARADVLKRGLALLVLATLVAGSLPFIVAVVGDLRPANAEAELRQVEEGLQQFLRTMGPYLNLPPEVSKQIIPNVRAGIGIGVRIANLPTPLPQPLGRMLENLGAFLSLPFGRLTGWIGYGLWVMLAAKLLGGRATVSQMLGATALYAVPHVLGILSVVPCLGGILGLAATVWGIAIYVKALAVANGFSIGRATAATVLPALAGGALALVGLLGLFVLALALGGA